MKCSISTCLGFCLTLLLTLAGPAQADSELIETSWRAVEIEGKPVSVEPGRREPHIQFSVGKRVSGSTGCNLFTGAYELEADALRFKPLATTKMACPPPLNTLEMEFLKALQATASMQQTGKTLEFKDGAGKVHMRLESR